MGEIKEGFSYSKEDDHGIIYDSNNDNFVDTNDKNNPTLSYIFVDDVKIPVWSIFLRKGGDIYGRDGNPLLYALKNEKNWHFYPDDGERDKFISQIDKILMNFLSFFPLDLTVVVPSSNDLNYLLARRIKKLRPEAEIITNALRKMTTEEVNAAIHKKDSKFIKIFGSSPKRLNAVFKIVDDAIIMMNNKHNGYFTYHELPPKGGYREAITDVLTYNESTKTYYAKEIFNRAILVIDDSIASGATLKSACKILENFDPKSISILTLFSSKKDKKSPNTDHISWNTVLRMNESKNTDIINDIPDNEIWYTSLDRRVVHLNTKYFDESLIVSNEYVEDYDIIKFKNAVNSIWEGAFESCKSLNAIYLPKSIKYIENMSFYDCTNLEKVEGLENVINYGNSAFYSSGIKEIVINAWAGISNFAFDQCKKLETVYLLGLSQNIESLSFVGCDNIKMVYVECSTSIDITRTNIREVLVNKLSGKWCDSEVRQIFGRVRDKGKIIK